MPDTPLLERLPPQNLDAERGVLGAMLLDPDAVNAAAELLRREDFYPRRHQIIFEALVELSESRQPSDVLAAEETLRRGGKLEEAGGGDYLRELLSAVPSAANIEYYAQLVRETAVRRHLIRSCTEIIRQSYEGAEETGDLLAAAERAVMDLSESHARADYARVDQKMIDKVLEGLEKLHGREGTLTGAATEFYDLDRITGGMRDGEIVILGGRPSCGKTTFALNVALRVALRKEPVGIFSLEMTHEQLVRNMLSMQSKVSFHKEDGLYLAEDEWAKVLVGAGELSEAPIFVDDSDHLDIREMRARARRLAHNEKIRLLIVDYLQLVRGPRFVENRQQEIAEISRALKGMAKELRCPVIALSQLSRDVEKSDRRPSMADLRESGAIEQDADVILLLSRENLTDAEDVGAAGGAGTQGLAMHLEVAKNRNGRTGAVTLQFHKDRLRFESMLFGPEAAF